MTSKFTKQLNAFLQQQTPEQVATWLVETISADTGLQKQWKIKLLLASGNASDYKKLLTQALPKKELLATPNLWRKVGQYFYQAEALFALAFEQLEQNDCPLTNEQQFTWLLQAFERLNTVVQSIDDSGGYRLELVEQLSQRLVRCFHQLPWPIEQKAAWLQEHQCKYDVFPYIPEQFALPADVHAAFVGQANNAQPEASDTNVSMALLKRLNREK
tara:strand:- start:495 stop:1142 length:648 start_codon:yes stop_codon:yes gene_type:complete